ncbi:30S ribosomal protein S18 [Mesomycoplasma lagogenitalium]|uniref:Small ribosomal subunit protein bS18 n=1 Tax=Mesomycoplasma lagogenitalium TaxID=171286 RepID=A0ABY8LUY6_9BACT|nr:30S ribosomal protein S18 [Mesomycoplasma lagogenitalium]
MNKKVKKQFKKRPCYFCLESIEYIDYKNTEVLEKFISNHGKIHPSRLTGTCSRHQRLLSTAIKRARIVALLPFVAERVRK